TYLRGFLGLTFAAALTAGSSLSSLALAQDTTSQSNNKSEQWIHVRVESKEDRGETVRVNVPVQMAVKVLPAIHQDKLHDGKLRIEGHHMDDVDLRAVLDAVRTARDGEYVTVQSNQNDVRVAKNAGYLYIRVTDKEASKKTAKERAGGSAHES